LSCWKDYGSCLFKSLLWCFSGIIGIKRLGDFGFGEKRQSCVQLISWKFACTCMQPCEGKGELDACCQAWS
jgi:hypothetical protein